MTQPLDVAMEQVLVASESFVGLLAGLAVFFLVASFGENFWGTAQCEANSVGGSAEFVD